MYINVRIEALHWPATSTRSRPRSSQRCSPPGRAAPRGPPPSPSGDSTWCPDIYISSAHSGSVPIIVLFTFIDFPCVAFSSVLAGAGALVLAGPGWRLVSPPRHRAAWPQRPHNLAQSTLRLRTIRRRRHVISMVNTRYIKDDFVLRSSLIVRYMQCSLSYYL